MKFDAMPQTYRQLVALHPPRPLHSEKDLAAATAIVDAMAGHRLNADQEDYLDLMATLVADYDRKHHPVTVRRMGPREVLAELLEEAGMSASDLGRLLGNRELGSKILRGERGLSMAHVAILSERFAVGPQLFMAKPPAQKVKVKGVRRGRGAWRGGVRAEEERKE